MADEKRTQNATLGCGTLILIALIVLFFSHPGIKDLESEVHGLRSDVRELKNTIEVQSSEIKSLRDKLDKAKGKE